jgi:hypothetical protein
MLTETEDSITRLFAAQGTRILRGERVAIESAGSKLNLLGVDYQSLAGRMEAPGHEAKEYLSRVERLLISQYGQYSSEPQPQHIRSRRPIRN